jgi:hypothetical protein
MAPIRRVMSTLFLAGVTSLSLKFLQVWRKQASLVPW